MNRTIFFSLFLSLAFTSSAQNFYNIDSIQKIEITFAQSNWDQLMDDEKAGAGNYIMAQTLVINGTSYDSVGVRYKGNSTYRDTRTKNPLHIELDTYKSQNHEGYKDIKLSNVYKDPSFVREVLSYEIIRNYMDAPLSNYANVYINGTLYGLYVSSESVSKTFVNAKFGSNKNVFVKCNPPDGAGPGATNLPNLEYKGQDSTDYYSAYSLKSDHGWAELIDLCDTLKNTTTNIEDMLDVDRVLWMLALNNVLVNLDSYIGGFKQNYYLYRDDYNRFLPVIWDLNESFGRFSMTGSGPLGSTTQKAQMDHMLNEFDTDFPLVQELMAIPMYKKMYLAHVKTILLEQIDNGDYYTRGQALQSIIDADVQADPNKFYTHSDFTNNLNSDIGGGMDATPGIKALMDARSTYLLGQSDFTQSEPTIANITLSNSSPALFSTISLTADITNEVDVWLGYRNTRLEPYTRIQMFDDGAHNDGAAGDGTYGIDLTVNSNNVHYFIYAENSGIGKFNPERAAYEYHEIHAAMAADVVINEFSASNKSIAADQDGEYDDWVELYNNTSSSIDLSGYGLSDDLNDRMKWTFPNGTSIGANDYLIVWADKDSFQTGLHAYFKISSGGEALYLSSPLQVILDQIVFDAQTSDITFGRYPNGVGSFLQMTPTHAAQNVNGIIGSSPEPELERNALRVYPNPANSLVYVQLEQQSNSVQELQVYNVMGKRVHSEQLRNQTILNVQEWSSGLYIIVSGGESRKLIVE